MRNEKRNVSDPFGWFADGAVLSQGQPIDALGLFPTGTPEVDLLSGTALTETINALGGDGVFRSKQLLKSPRWRDGDACTNDGWRVAA